jgi:hypothetical protein
METIGDLLWNGRIWEENPFLFLALTVILGGGAAYMAGRAVALAWKRVWLALVYIVLLGLALRFLHFALFEGTLLSLQYFAVDMVVLLIAGLLGYRITRVNQMVTQYRWLYERRGLFAWRSKPSAAHGFPVGTVS